MKTTQIRMPWNHAVWKATKIARHIGKPVYIREHDGFPWEDRYSLALTRPKAGRRMTVTHFGWRLP